jgi:hypothetical protein
MTNVKTREFYDTVINGAGLASLVTGAYLAGRLGYCMELYDQGNSPDGSLIDLPPEQWPTDVLPRELKPLMKSGVNFHPKQTLWSNLSWTDLQKYSGILIATGTRCTPIYSSRKQMTNLLRLSSRERLR